jgi:para-nitrobenzyl esterase
MNKISRKQFLQRSAMGMGSVLLFQGWGLSACSETDGYVTANTSYGKIRGIRERGVNIFKGIPYAGRVSGDRRFNRPAPLEPWPGIRDALRLGNPAIQAPNQTYGIDEPEYAEDCLFLNVWTPANDRKKRPVMFYNHGGGFATGSGGSVAQDGANLARYFDVVVVETNHRLNIFGFLYLGEVAGKEYKTSGNNGMLDIVDGLKWVNQNIAEFGGDPGNVMIFGESGGGSKTSCLYAMPGAAKYFNKASIESGPGIRMTPIESAIVTTNLLLKVLNIDPKDWRKLLELPADQIYAAQAVVRKAADELASARPPSYERSRGIGGSRIGEFSPVVDGIALPVNPFDPTAPEISRDKPLIVGWNEDEYTFMLMRGGDASLFNMDFDGLQERLKQRFGEDTQLIIDTYRKDRPEATPIQIFIEISSVTMMGLGSIEIVEKKTIQKGAPAYLYNFGYKSEVKIKGTDYPIGTPHAMDIAFKFNNVREDGFNNASGMAGSRPESYKASHNFAELWTTYARTGKPGAEGQPEWPPYDLDKRPTYRIDTECQVIYDRNKAERELWTSLGYIESPG